MKIQNTIHNHWSKSDIASYNFKETRQEQNTVWETMISSKQHEGNDLKPRKIRQYTRDSAAPKGRWRKRTLRTRGSLKGQSSSSMTLAQNFAWTLNARVNGEESQGNANRLLQLVPVTLFPHGMPSLAHFSRI